MDCSSACTTRQFQKQPAPALPIESPQKKSSKDYAIHVPRTKAWYDAEHFDGNNLGCFGKPTERAAFADIDLTEIHCAFAPPLTDSDWTEEEKVIDKLCNCEFKCGNRQMVLVPRHNMKMSSSRINMAVQSVFTKAGVDVKLTTT